MTIIIPDELVPLLRDGLYFDLHGQLEEAGALIEPRGRADIRVAVDGCLTTAKGTRAASARGGAQDALSVCCRVVPGIRAGLAVAAPYVA